MILKSVVAVKKHNFASGVFVTYLGFFKKGIVGGFTKNLRGGIAYDEIWHPCESSIAKIICNKLNEIISNKLFTACFFK